MSSIYAQSPTEFLHSVDKRIVIAVAAFAAATIIGATSFAAADNPHGDKPTKEWCAAHGFSNYGQCVSQWAHTKGYGG